MRLDGFTFSWFAIGIVAAILVNTVFMDLPSRAGLVSGPWPLKA